MSAPRVRFKKLHPGALTPRYMSEGAAGLDLAYPSGAGEAIRVEPGARVAVPTGLAFEIPRGFEGQVRPRSGLARKFGVTVVNAPGTIDSDYRGEVAVLLVNLGDKAHTIEPGDRIAQLIIAPVVSAQLEEAAELEETTRGAGGFGHTG
jgi:dUTP pyrophosphatase